MSDPTFNIPGVADLTQLNAAQLAHLVMEDELRGHDALEELGVRHTRLRVDLDEARDGARHLGHTLNCLSITMQAAAIASEQQGPKAGMEWILNTLVEAGMHPRTADDRYDDDLGCGEDSLVLPGETAQQFYDRQIARARADRDALVARRSQEAIADGVMG